MSDVLLRTSIDSASPRITLMFCAAEDRRIGRRCRSDSAGRGHLIEQRLEEVVVVTVDHGDVGRNVFQAPPCKPAKPPPMMTMCGMTRARNARSVSDQAPGNGWQLAYDPAHVASRDGSTSRRCLICRRKCCLPSSTPLAMAAR